MRFILPLVVSAACLLRAAAIPTFSKDVAPILQKRCQECHRPGEIGPFSLLTYKDARPWAKAIRNAVANGSMPPWHADKRYGKFANGRSMPQSEIDTIAAWANNGSPEGDPMDLPKPAVFTEGWGIPKPDVVFQLPAPYQIPAKGTIDYLHWVVPSGFKEDKWIQFAEARPGDRSHVHHIIAYVREPGSQWMKDIQPGVPFVEPKPDPKSVADTSALPSDFLVGYAPGQPPEAFEPGRAKLVRAGSDIIIQVHYTTDGKPSTDVTRIGLVFAKERPKERIKTFSATNGTFKIPPGAANHQVDAEFQLGSDVVLHGLHPHMHSRGKDFIYHVRFPDGRRETLLSVPKYSFAWQLWYNLETPMFLPKGTVIECTAHFDNSPNNKFNPDPSKEVRWGDQSWDEMMVGFFNFAFDAAMDESTIQAAATVAQAPPKRKQVLFFAQELGYRHQAVSHAAATIERLGRESGLWDTHIRTDTEVITKKKLEYNARNLDSFDAAFFYSGGNPPMDDEQKAALLSFVKDDGKGLVAAHSAAITWPKWPEFVDMVGGTFDEHPWNTFDAPVLVEDAAFPGMSQWPKAFSMVDEIYQMKSYTRENTRVLLRLDSAKLDMANPKVHRKDGDFPVAWAKMYGKGRVFYSSLGHVESNWDRKDMQTMYFEAIRWALRLVDAAQ